MAEQSKEKRIVVYDMDRKSAVYQLPVLEDILSIQISRFGLQMLISSQQAPFQAWEFDANLDSSSLHVIPILRRYTVVHTGDIAKEEYSGRPATFGGIQDDFVFSVTDAGKIRVWYRNPRSLELRYSYLLSLGSDQEDEGAPMIQQLTWRPSSPTFAVTRHTGEGASVIQLWTAPQPTSRSSALPIIRTTTSQGSAVSLQEHSAGESGIRRSSSYTPSPVVRSPPSPSIGHSFADIAAQATSKHMQSAPHITISSTGAMV
ncbi:hypothetical protein P691DRAFT_291268 [Macrolepiota fuliginosa MF-IS2]|uniref:Uncharacterized protein n=1 Tax=Macrolepiota fuliginosa MF-IS2 TaxID=1400762 RepID=A0A9P5X5Y9_9AGAR|nr:hypothetical protein P691DRAFT_291268 [Macrolepiota fuliginosa MF-IS2]